MVTGHSSPAAGSPPLCIRRRGRMDYLATWEAMRQFTAERTVDTPDELWLLEHRPVYTYGVAGRVEHLPRSDAGIPVIKVDRGGQVTYHGPGQAVVYTLIDLRRAGITVRDLVGRLEQAVLDLLSDHSVIGERRPGAPGVYVAGAKLAALGLRIRNGCSFHGVSLNVDLDLAPFSAIDPCGYPGLAVTRTRDLGLPGDSEQLGIALARHIARQLQRHTELA